MIETNIDNGYSTDNYEKFINGLIETVVEEHKDNLNIIEYDDAYWDDILCENLSSDDKYDDIVTDRLQTCGLNPLFNPVQVIKKPEISGDFSVINSSLFNVDFENIFNFDASKLVSKFSFDSSSIEIDMFCCTDTYSEMMNYVMTEERAVKPPIGGNIKLTIYDCNGEAVNVITFCNCCLSSFNGNSFSYDLPEGYDMHLSFNYDWFYLDY